jgi:DNA-binding NarL/FixJ family response regulator
MLGGTVIQRTVLVVEDDPMTLGLVMSALEHEGFRVVGASSPSSAIQSIRECDPDAVVLDVELGSGPTGFDIATAIGKKYPHIGILFLTHLPDARFAHGQNKSVPKGAGYLRKDRLIEPQVLVDAIESVLRNDGARTIRDDKDPARPLSSLTRTQIEVMQLVADGLSNQEIAEMRGTSLRAVQDLVTRCLSGMGIGPDDPGHSRVLAARKYIAAAGLNK